jgi:hypothetical protein
MNTDWPTSMRAQIPRTDTASHYSGFSVTRNHERVVLPFGLQRLIALLASHLHDLVRTWAGCYS